MCAELNLGAPERITSVSMRKYIATLSQVSRAVNHGSYRDEKSLHLSHRLKKSWDSLLCLGILYTCLEKFKPRDHIDCIFQYNQFYHGE